MTDGGPLILVDAMSLTYRAFFALPDTLTTVDGLVTNRCSLHGFVFLMLINIVRDHRPSALAVAFDLPGGTFRHALVPDYKGGRSATPETLTPQFDMVREGARRPECAGRRSPEASEARTTCWPRLATQARDRGLGRHRRHRGP